MSEIEELIYKVTVELNEDDLQKAKKKVQDLKETVKQAGIKIDVPTTDWTQVQAGTQWPDEFKKQKSEKDKQKSDKDKETAEKKDTKQVVDEVKAETKEKEQKTVTISDTLKKSEQHLSSILDLVKKMHRLHSKKLADNTLLDSEDGGGSDNSKGGKGLISAVTGGIFSIVKTIGGFVVEAVKLAIDVAQRLTNTVVEKNSRELNLHKLSSQTDLSIKSLYKLKFVAETLGTSLEEVVSSAKKMQKEFLFGMDEQKAMSMMALGINPFQAMGNMMEDPLGAQNKFFKVAQDKTKHMPKAMQSTFLESLGFSSDLQFALKNQNNKDVQASAAEVSNARGNFLPQDEFLSQNAIISGKLASVQASLDKALDQNKNLVDKFVITYADMQAQTINLIGNVVKEATDKIESTTGDIATKGQEFIKNFSENPKKVLETGLGYVKEIAKEEAIDTGLSLLSKVGNIFGGENKETNNKNIQDNKGIQNNNKNIQDNKGIQNNNKNNFEKSFLDESNKDPYKNLDSQIQRGRTGKGLEDLQRKKVNNWETPQAPPAPFSLDPNRSQSKMGNN